MEKHIELTPDYKILGSAFDADNPENETLKIFEKDGEICVWDGENMFSLNTQNFRTGIYKHYKGNQYEVFGALKYGKEIFVVYRGLYKHDEEKFGQNLWYRNIKNFAGETLKDGKQVSRFSYIGNIG